MVSHIGWKNYTCTKCPESFSMLASLKNHERSHLKKKNSICELCEKVNGIMQKIIFFIYVLEINFLFLFFRNLLDVMRYGSI